jgi:hypothetical protein
MQYYQLAGRVICSYSLCIIGRQRLIGCEEDGYGVLEKGEVQVWEGGGGGRCRGQKVVGEGEQGEGQGVEGRGGEEREGG